MIFKVVSMMTFAGLVLLAKHVDDLSYDIAKNYAETALAIAAQGGDDPSPQVAQAVENLKSQAELLCLRSFISRAMIPGSAGRCSEMIAENAKVRSEAEKLGK